MTNPLRPDICIIGAGQGAVALAMGASSAGAGVVLVDRDGVGGARLLAENVGRSLVAAGKRAHAVREAARLGIGAAGPEIDFREVMNRARDVAEASAPDEAAARLTAMGVKIIRAVARFKDRNTIVADEVEIRAKRFVLATGTVTAAPDIPGLPDIGCLTPGTLADLRTRPGHLVVLGDDGEAIALAQTFRRLGSQVSLICPTAPLPREDPEMVAVLLRQLHADGVSLLDNAKVSRVERRGKTGMRVLIEGPDGTFPLDGTHLMVTPARLPDLADLELDKAGISRSGDAIAVDARLRMGNRRVLAIGDAIGAPRAAHLAEYQAGLALRAMLFRASERQDLSAMPRVVFADPELARVGLTEAEAVAGGKPIRILRWPFAENARARAEGTTAGHIKLVVGPKGRILGVTIAGAQAAELISTWSLALSKGLGLADIAAHTPAHATLGEIGKRAAITYFAEAARKAYGSGIVKLMRLFG